MGERKGVNKYYPPDFDYKKHGSLDRYHNSHPLRERARKLSEGILIIRFEMPYNIWCNGCNSHIGMGVRYNAEKKKVGNYYSTIIYKFRMKCHLCDQHFEIQTDPANCEYVILSGARRKEERWNAKDNEQIEMTDREVKKQLISDPMFKLEHQVKDKKKLETVIPTLGEIHELQEEKKDDYLLNKALRKTFREQKKRLEEVAKSDDALLKKSSLDINLLPESESDKKIAKLLQFQTIKSYDTKQAEARKEINSRPVLKSTSISKSDAIQNLSTKLPQTLSSVLKPHAADVFWSTKPKKQPSASGMLGAKLVKRKLSQSNTSPLQSNHAQCMTAKMSRSNFDSKIAARKNSTEENLKLKHYANLLKTSDQPNMEEYKISVSEVDQNRFFKTVTTLDKDKLNAKAECSSKSGSEMHEHKSHPTSLVAYVSDASSDNSD